MLKVKDYECQECWVVSEIFSKQGDPDPKLCPKCFTEALEPLLSAPAFKLEGLTGSFPSAYDRWAADHERTAQRRKEKNREFKEHRAKEEKNVI